MCKVSYTHVHLVLKNNYLSGYFTLYKTDGGQNHDKQANNKQKMTKLGGVKIVQIQMQILKFETIYFLKF